MKKFILHILLFFAIVAVVDFAAGKTLYYLQSHAGGRTGAEWYACKESHEDIIIMGSSRASHHYVPQIFEDSLGLSCFNAGQDGNGIILQYGRWKMITERYTPKMIIYDINPAFDLCQNDNMAYIDRLKPFCNNHEVKDFVSEIFPLERLKLFSQMYRYNYKYIEIISDCARIKGDKLNGYIPLYGKIKKEIVEATRPVKKVSVDEDNVKIDYLERFAQDCKVKGVQLVFVASPAFRGGTYNKDIFNSVKRIAQKNDSFFYDFYDSEFSNNPDLFKDSQHLNDVGAIFFINEVINQLRAII